MGRQAKSADAAAGPLAHAVPAEVGAITDPQRQLPKIAKDEKLVERLQRAAMDLPTEHRLRAADARAADWLEPESVHLVLTSPPYWTLKQYRRSKGQMGDIADYELFLAELERVWQHCFRALVPGGRLICVVGDVCLSRRRNAGRHTVVPLHAAIQE
ncbi:MAG: DNA methyltransferase, partial [Chloroflexota bacterium]